MFKRLFPQSFWLVTHLFLSSWMLRYLIGPSWLVKHLFLSSWMLRYLIGPLWFVKHLFLSSWMLRYLFGPSWLVKHLFDYFDWLYIYFHTHFWFATYLSRSSFEIGMHLFRPLRLAIHLFWPPWLPMHICCRFLFVLCVVCSSSIYGLWLPLWYFLTLLTNNRSCWYKDDTGMECE